VPSRLEEFRFARWAKSLNRGTQILLSLLLVGGLNYLAARHFERWDLTSNQRFSLSAETRSYIDKIDRTPGAPPVQIILNEINVTPQPTDSAEAAAQKTAVLEDLRALLREYQFAALSAPGGKAPLQVEEVDVYRDSLRAKELADMGMADDTVVMVARQEPGPATAQKKYRVHSLTGTDLYDSQDRELTNFKGENAITSAILDVTESTQDKIYFTAGHGEMSPEDPKPQTGLSTLAHSLRERNFDLEGLDLKGNVEADIPADAKLVIVAAPQIAFQPYEAAKLLRYLNKNNGRLMVFLNPPATRGQHTGLEDLFSDWGIRADEMLVVEPDKGYLASNGDIIIRNIARHDITDFIEKNSFPIDFSPWTRPVRPDEGAAPNSDRQVTALLGTSAKSTGIRNYFNGPPYKADEYDLSGPVPVATLSELRPHDALGLPGGRLLVFGNAEFIANLRFASAEANSYLFLNAFDYLLSRQNLLNIAPKPPLKFQLNLTKAQYLNLGWRLALLPAGLMFLGIFVYVIRRRA